MRSSSLQSSTASWRVGIFSPAYWGLRAATLLASYTYCSFLPELYPEVQLADLVKSEISDAPAAVAGPVDCGVVQEHGDAILGELQVHLHSPVPFPIGQSDARESILGVAAAVGDERVGRHDAGEATEPPLDSVGDAEESVEEEEEEEEGEREEKGRPGERHRAIQLGPGQQIRERHCVRSKVKRIPPQFAVRGSVVLTRERVHRSPAPPRPWADDDPAHCSFRPRPPNDTFSRENRERVLLVVQ